MKTNYLKPYFKSFFVALMFCFGITSVLGQTNPETGSLPYSYGGSTEIPSTMAVHRFGSIQTTRTTSDANNNLSLVTNNTSGGYMIEGTGGVDGISLLASSSQQAGAIVVEISTLGKENISVSYVAWTKLDQNSRTNSIALQYRVGETGTWINVDSPNSSVYTTSAVGRSNGVNFNLNLPSEANDKPIVQVRWIYWESSGTSGSRDRLGIDDILITGEDSNSTQVAMPTFSAIGVAN